MTILGTTVIMLAIIVAAASYFVALSPIYKAVSPFVCDFLDGSFEEDWRLFGLCEPEQAEIAGSEDAVESDSRKEPETGIAFPFSESFEVGKNLQLLGVGVRKKAILKVYSLGFYGNKPVVKALSGKSGDEACDAILSPNLKGARAVKLMFNMGVGTDKVAEAMAGVEGASEEVKGKFLTMLKKGMGQGKMSKGESMSFEWKGNNVVVVTVRGSKIGEIKDKGLHKGLLEIYLGSKSVSPSLKKDLGTMVQ
eukprot:CAMPEP_0183303850 /NCGR_PEP_ID=MMETSP0160_2-20130417/9144_1 /TAXON_ID=2839 ORGANISM="Odontella Sinensis, Strain Grunow 1884" /NCGR_SAMPLE_ID=MMETSP0160_2 /ASSEMBLY_ACC=CAM_ASM_000250 /LENGTH=250 /DNA_ID=CAMNT_0025466813 /DNA_START=34 /DNA_END=786 /DNA_ORIENTATION=-